MPRSLISHSCVKDALIAVDSTPLGLVRSSVNSITIARRHQSPRLDLHSDVGFEVRSMSYLFNCEQTCLLI